MTEKQAASNNTVGSWQRWAESSNAWWAATTVGKVIVGIASTFAVAGLILSFMSYKSTESNTAQQYDLALKGQFSERFNRAIEELASDKLDIRVGGIYSLRAIGQQSSNDRATVEDVLRNFIYEHSAHIPCTTNPDLMLVPKDIETALQAIGSLPKKARPPVTDVYQLDDETRAHQRGNFAFCWWGAILPDAHLYDFDLSGSVLSSANLRGTTIDGLRAFQITLDQADLRGANLDYAELTRANMKGADVRNIHLFHASLIDARLCGSWFDHATLDGADFQDANLSRASFDHTAVSGTEFKGAKLIGAFFRHMDLSQAHLEGADLTGLDYDSETIWPLNFPKPPRAKQDLKIPADCPDSWGADE